jgi:arginine utilization regulatory protein
LSSNLKLINRERLLLLSLQKILHSIEEGIHIIDAEGRSIIYNKAMEKIEGLSANEVLDRPLLEVFPKLNSFDSTLITALEKATPIEQHKQSYLNFKKQRIASENTTFPIFSGSKVVGALEIAQNYTDVNELTEKIADLQQKLIKPPKPRRADPPTYTFDKLIGGHPTFLSAVEIARRAAKTDSSVLIYGETGTGKELIAQSIHNACDNRNGSLVAVNCGALPETLLEGLLFGTTKGSYTGAMDRPGLFEQAHNGTLFLDEINSMSLALQVKLLRALQENRVRRLGGLEDLEIDVRIIAASNEELQPMIKEGLFRKDLYYRINVINITIPPLRERKEDIPLLTDHFLKIYNSKMNKDVWMLSPEMHRLFYNYSWLGNIRELQNVIEGAMVMVDDVPVLDLKHLPGHFDLLSIKPDMTEKSRDNASLTEKLSEGLAAYIDSIEKSIIEESLKFSRNNISHTATVLGISRQSLQYKIKRLGLKKEL